MKKELIGKTIQWNEHFCPKRGYGVYTGVVTDIKGKNIEINNSDWRWEGDMKNIKILEGNHEPTTN